MIYCIVFPDCAWAFGVRGFAMKSLNQFGAFVDGVSSVMVSSKLRLHKSRMDLSNPTGGIRMCLRLSVEYEI